MNASDYLTELLPQLTAAKLAYRGWRRAPRPFTLTFSVTNACQSRCQTCRIWELYRQHPERRADELTLDEIERVFASLGRVYFFNVSGGEPFLRDDLADIFELALRHLTPRVLHSPTNALAPQRVEAATERVLRRMRELGHDAPLTIKPSLDGIGAQHDAIRGVPGNFERVLETLERLKRLRARYPNLHVEVGTVISRANMGDVEAIAAYAHTLGIESYRHEIAEQRAEFFNLGDPITPTPEEYAALTRAFARQIRENVAGKRELAQLTESLRLVYYEYAARILQEGRQVLPCYAGITNAHINPYGQVWPCCVLGYDQPMGELREAGYDFMRVWHSPQADVVRAYIKAGNCACPLANQAYSNILANPAAMAKAVGNLVQFKIGHRRDAENAESKRG